MTETFELSGDPDAILGSAQHWTNFGSSSHSAAGDVSSLDATQFSGDEGDTYRSRINHDMTPHLTTAGEAWSNVGSALQTYAHSLRELQQQMSALKTDAAEQKSKVDSSQQAVHQAQQADRTNAAATTPNPSYRSGTDAATTGHANAVGAYNGSVSQAATIRKEHRHAIQKCCSSIDDAKHKRFQKPPGFWDKVKSVGSAAWDGFKKGLSFAAQHIAPLLDVVAMVAGVLALVPFLAPVMGPIALAAGGLSLGIKVLDKVLNGSDTSWFEIGVSAVALVPGVRPLTTIGKLGKLSAVAKVAGRTGNELGVARKALTVAKNAGKGVRTAKRAVSSATEANVAARAAQAALKGRYARIDKVWTWTDRGLVAVLAAGNTKVTYDRTGRWDAAVVAGATSLIGLKVNPGSKKFTAVQGIVSNAAATGNQAYQMTVQGKWDDPKEWLKVGAAVAKTGISCGNTVAYSSAGTHPNGSTRAAHELPNHWG